MSVCWNLYRFDYKQFLTIRPDIRKASTPETFAATANTSALRKIAKLLEEGSINLGEAKEAYIQEVCCVDEPVALYCSFPRILSFLCRRSETEEFAEQFGEMLNGLNQLETWLLPANELVAILPPEGVKYLQKVSANMRDGGGITYDPSASAKGQQLINDIDAAYRQVLDKDAKAEDTLSQIIQLIDEACSLEEGLLVVEL